MKIGVLALQGAFIEHIGILQKLGVETSAIRLPDELGSLDGLIIPGGESTTILKLMQSSALFHPLKELAQDGLPVWGTCAGLICLARKVSSCNMDTLSAMDIAVRRNAFGRQVDSFETELSMPELGDKPFPAIFIRAPIVEDAGPEVEILARLPDSTAVVARQGKLLVSSFHPELNHDLRFHDYFVKIVASH